MNHNRQFPRPWRIEEDSTEALSVRDATGFVIFRLYHGNTDRERDMGLMTTEDAWKIAKGIVRRINEEPSQGD